MECEIEMLPSFAKEYLAEIKDKDLSRYAKIGCLLKIKEK